MTKPALSITFLALLSGLVHAVLIVYGEWQDSHMRVSYTDIDYWVYSDAARHVFNGASAFDRHTYRYTPLLAWLAWFRWRTLPGRAARQAWQVALTTSAASVGAWLAWKTR